MIKLVKTDVDSVGIFVYKEQFEFDVFDVFRKEDDEWVKIETFNFIPDEVFYQIKGSNKFHREPDSYLYKTIFYNKNEKVKEAILQPFAYNVPHWQRGIIKMKRYEFFIKAKKINGNMVLIFKQLDDKIPCPECWDSDLQSSTNSNCSLCGGSGYIKKYSKPIFTWGGPYMNQPSAPPKGTIDGLDKFNPHYGAIASITLLPDVPIEMYDLIYVINSGELNIVHSVSQTYFHNQLMSQNVTCASLPSETREFKAVEKDIAKKIKEINGIHQ